ncbi:hypothetical protein G647_07495 [Cladophialophora carrionii CBS 160.54]|uniref:Uncharacterized protein n=1 Tax=Cladophialophora carrionii CBS 160.54 TaxID=1279043 RepID=V9D3B0_9EURO|nr:uncharacterized protein G647_07495 [Cladophialophora carrionii CBS 160.54]ETI21151.1 hypothetical protein G647_07495 [Cladophialophora carrionii CBS 160.54]
MASVEAHDAYCRLADDLEQYWSADEDLNRTHAAIISSLKSASDHPNVGRQQIMALMPPFARHVGVIVQKGRPEDFQSAILGTLADATREVPIWRPLFGLAERPDRAMNLKQMNRDTPPDSILEVARRIVARTIHVSSSEEIRSALRIIANSCADNNVNRSSFIGRDGIEALLELLRLRKDCDLVIPVLYNVCVDFDEPAMDVHGKPWAPLPQMRAASGEISTPSTLSMAEQRLGTYRFPHENKTSFQILLEAREQAEDCAETLADLIEMASRVALYGTRCFAQEHDGNEPGDIIEVDTTVDIVRLLLSQGADLAEGNIECRVSICQAVLNLLSQQDTHTTVINSDNAIRKLIYLPYPPTHVQGTLKPEEDDEEEENALSPYQKEILKLTYTISATEAYAETFDIGSRLIQSCILDLDRFLDDQSTPTSPPASVPLASICVLLANCINTTDRAKKLLRDGPDIALVLQSLFIKISDPEILLPAVDLAARLALCPEGQDAFCKGQISIFLAIAQILHNGASEVDTIGLEVQRNAVALARLLVKGQSEDVLSKFSIGSRHAHHAGDLFTATSLTSEVYSLWDRTTDAQTKIEIGRLFIEILRTIHGPKRNPAVRIATTVAEHKTAHAPTQPPTFSLTDEFNGLDVSSATPMAGIFEDKVAEMITYTLAQPQGQLQSQPQPQPSPLASMQTQQHDNNAQAQAQAQAQAEAEAWFGLALLSTMTSARPSIRATLARNDFNILKQLRQIVASNASPVMKEDGTKPPNPADQTVGQQRQRQARQVIADPRYENIKVLVVKMLQTEQQQQQQLPSPSPSWKQTPAPGLQRHLSREDELVQEGLEAAATEMGLDWVVV